MICKIIYSGFVNDVPSCRDAYLRLSVERRRNNGADNETQICVSTTARLHRSRNRYRQYQMLFRIDRSYKSLMTVEQIEQVLEYLSTKKSNVFGIKIKIYDVEAEGMSFSVRRRGGSQNGPIYPLIKGEITQADFIQVDLEIKPSYFYILFIPLIGIVMSFIVLLSDEMTVNGIYRSVDLAERIGWSLFSIIITMTLAYFKTIKPVQDAEKWLIKKLKLEPISG